ncbi:ABC transporter permease [bacterium]|nr:ABC transporter permease [bacterium]
MNLTLPEAITHDNLKTVLADLSDKIKNSSDSVTIDLEGVRLDSLTKAVIRNLTEQFPDKVTVSQSFTNDVFYDKTELDEEESESDKESTLENIGSFIIARMNDALFFGIIMVDMIYYSIEIFWNKKFLVKGDIIKNAYFIGYKAINIIFLLSFLIGLTITIQAAVQLAKMGGQSYIATLIGYSMIKELGPLITAIIIAGRTGSSIAAEIGTMVVMEEVDAISTMGIKPFKFLLVPKFWAFSLAMPILTLLSDFSGIVGGMFVAMFYGIPAKSFMTEILLIVTPEDLFWGTMKSLTFAWVILAVASFKGLHVRGGADSVGRATTESVVISIFMVVVIDAIYSLILYT